MPRKKITYNATNYYPNIICDYVAGKESLCSFFDNNPTALGLSEQVENKKKVFSDSQRKNLREVLLNQYKGILTPEIDEQIQSLGRKNTFTITTGHQLNLFTGPMYFFYKIITTIQLAQHMRENYPKYHFVPVYWMATEDHDFEEINHFHLHDKLFHWNLNLDGAVGRLPTERLNKLFSLLDKELGKSQQAEDLKELFVSAYLKNYSLAKATRILVNKLFGEYGLVIIDADEPSLKKAFIPHIVRDITEGLCHNIVSSTNEKLKNKNYPIQVNPREINLFYLHDGRRDRLVTDQRGYRVLDTSYHWTQSELLHHIECYPERFSPNVLLRPLYQEVILPNICYVGGAGELSYWFQLKSFFDASKIPFPVLMPRHSALLASDKQHRKIIRLGLDYENLFVPDNDFVNTRIRSISNINIDFNSQKEHLHEQFVDLYDLAKKTDSSFLGAVAAQEKKQIKGLEQLEKRLLKAQKRVLADEVSRAMDIKRILFPNGNLQERVTNFSEFYLHHGENLIPKLMREMQPFDYRFLII